MPRNLFAEIETVEPDPVGGHRNLFAEMGVSTKSMNVDPDYRGVQVQNPDGTTSSERTMTVGIDDKFYNIPTLFEGKQLTREQSIDYFKSGKMPAVGVADTLDTAVEMAGKRTAMLGEEGKPKEDLKPKHPPLVRAAEWVEEKAEEYPTLATLAKNATAPVESAMSLASGMALYLPAKAYGLMALPYGREVMDMADESIASFGYEPYTEEGKAAGELMAKGFELFLKHAEKAEEFIEDLPEPKEMRIQEPSGSFFGSLGYKPPDIRGEAAYIVRFGIELATFAATGGMVKGVKAKMGQKPLVTKKGQMEVARVRAIKEKLRAEKAPISRRLTRVPERPLAGLRDAEQLLKVKEGEGRPAPIEGRPQEPYAIGEQAYVPGTRVPITMKGKRPLPEPEPAILKGKAYKPRDLIKEIEKPDVREIKIKAKKKFKELIPVQADSSYFNLNEQSGKVAFLVPFKSIRGQKVDPRYQATPFKGNIADLELNFSKLPKRIQGAYQKWRSEFARENPDKYNELINEEPTIQVPKEPLTDEAFGRFEQKEAKVEPIKPIKKAPQTRDSQNLQGLGHGPWTNQK